jgi:hypothetical protein
VPILTVGYIHHIALVAYCTFLAILLVVFYSLLSLNDPGGRLTRVILIFVACPATLALVARNLGRFDLFLTIIALLSLTLLSANRHLWLVPALMVVAMFIHEAFLILYVPTILAAMVFLYIDGPGEKRMLATIVVSALLMLTAYFVLSVNGTPSIPYAEFVQSAQMRANFRLTELSMTESYYTIRDHVRLASSSLLDPGSIVNLLMALIMLSPTVMILVDLWSHVKRNNQAQRRARALFILSTMSGLLMIPIATDYGRWLSAILFSNFFALFFLISRGAITVDDLGMYEGRSFSMLFVPLFLTYVLFGPFHDWNPYPYQGNLTYSIPAIVAVLLFDAFFLARWRGAGKGLRPASQA